jgi:iron(III) transport system substrate-binding protein
MQDGLPIAVIDPRSMREGSHTTSGPANVALADRPPHPNAAKLYLNWVLSHEGGSHLSTSMGDPSTRVDVPIEQANAWAVPEPSWMVTNDEVALGHEERLLALLNELFAQ